MDPTAAKAAEQQPPEAPAAQAAAEPARTPREAPAAPPAWHALSVADALAAASATPGGLSKAEAAARLQAVGPNVMTPAPGKSLLLKAWGHGNNIISYILCAAAIISAAFNDWIEFALILAVVFINVAIGLAQEGKAEQATAAIRSLAKTTALALRGGKRVQLDAAELVPGDVVFVTAGDRLPADVRWLSVSSLQVTEAMLTGESAPVTKSVAPVEEDATLGDRVCMGFTGTLAFTGSGSAVVVATGDRAEVGKLNALMTQTEVAKTPLLVGIERFGQQLSIACILVAVATFLIAYLGRARSLRDSLVVGVSCAVALIPEGLPTVVTITLVYGVTAMAKRNAVIRQLPAVETLGALTVICSDKTGTLTKNEMTAVGVHTADGGFRVTGTGYAPDGEIKTGGGEDPVPADVRACLRQLLLPAVCCNDATLMPTRSPDAVEMLATQHVTIPLPDTDAAAAAAAAADGGDAALPRRMGSVEQASLRLARLEGGVGNGAAAAAVLVKPPPPVAAGGKEGDVELGQSAAAVATSSSSLSLHHVDSSIARVRSSSHHVDSSIARVRSSSHHVDSSIARVRLPHARVEWNSTGDPTECALLALAMKAGLNLKTVNELSIHCPRLDTVPFSSDTKFMITVHDLAIPPPANGSGGGSEQLALVQRVMLVKGAPDVLLPRCASQAGCGPHVDPWAPTPLQLERWLAAAAELSREGLRVLALCSVRVPATQTSFTAAEIALGPPRLHLHCLVSILDPPRDEVKAAIAEAHGAGIAVKMITGDHAETARSIGRLIGIVSDDVLTGAQMAGMSDEELSARVEGCNIFARATPAQKLRIVSALYQHGHVVAMTGDGVNDAPALKAASVGVAMGITGTEVAKEASKMVLADDNFATIVTAVRQGRGVYDNLRKLLVFILPTSVAQGLSMTAAMIIDVPEPLTIIQLLYVNIVTAISLGLVLAAEEPEADVMQRAPRKQAKGLVGKLVAWRAVFIGLLLIVAMLGQQQWTLSTGGSLARGHTMALNTLVVSQCVYVLNCRFFAESSLTWRAVSGNVVLTTMIVLTGALQCLITYTPGVQQVFTTEAINGLEWLRVLAFAAAIFLIVEAEKFFKPARFVVPPAHRACAAVAGCVGAWLPRGCCCGGRRGPG